MDGLPWAIVYIVVVLAAFFICGFAIENQNLRNKRYWEERDRKLKIKRLREENEIIALEQNKHFLEQIRPLKNDVKGAGLLRQRDEHTIDALMARDALSKTIEMLRVGPRLIEGNPLAASANSIAQEIENRRADGGETNDLEAILARLRSVS